ncbi:MAG: NAD(P)-dependent oxidoreductase [Chloroflexi bacterium]|nr:MAG: NAD(P)-dependent oxidoreductase [Chloroflexota bacterium]
MRIAVTGGNGDMGCSLIPYLLEQGHTIVSIDRALPANDMLYLSDLDFMAADMRDFGQFVASIRGCEALIHLAAIRGPFSHPDQVVYADNTLSSYNALHAAATLGIKRVCLASSINAIGGAFSRSPRYDYFPVDEQHPTYAEEPYGLSKWVLEQQADAFARRYEWMSIASLRLHMLISTREEAVQDTAGMDVYAIRHLWAYTLFSEANRACLLSLTADFTGHEVFYITAPNSAAAQPSLELARQYYPQAEIRGDLSNQISFFNCAKAGRLLGWQHQED